VRALENAFNRSRVEVARGRRDRQGVAHRLVAVEGGELLGRAQVDGGQRRHPPLEPVEELGRVRKPGQEARCLRGAGQAGGLLAGRWGGTGQARRLVGDSVGGHDGAGGIEDLDAHGVDAHADRLPRALAGRGVVRAVDGDGAVPLDRARFLTRGGIRHRGERDVARLLFGVGLVDGWRVVPWARRRGDRARAPRGWARRRPRARRRGRPRPPA
jgi:hypothetical protein